MADTPSYPTAAIEAVGPWRRKRAQAERMPKRMLSTLPSARQANSRSNGTREANNIMDASLTVSATEPVDGATGRNRHGDCVGQLHKEVHHMTDLTSTQAANLLGCNRITAQRAARAGKVHGARPEPRIGKINAPWVATEAAWREWYETRRPAGRPKKEGSD